MTTRANSSRERILTAAEAIILEKGYTGTNIDEILDKAAITKGGFFYHFNGKGEMARALVERYIEHDMTVFTELLERTDKLSEDPLQRVLIFLNLFSEMVSGMSATHPGCLVAAFTYEMQQFDEDVRKRMLFGVMEWRRFMAERLELVMERYKPRINVSVDVLADMFTSTLEGGIILARVLDNNQALIDQVQAYRSHLRLVFDPSVSLDK
ncbi:MAG: TetR/AcrR family transcriptional regulator [Pseudohongiellaceae bacterium]